MSIVKGAVMSTKRNFYVTAIWDEEAGIYYSESDIIGLHIEAETIEEFEQVIDEFAAELIIENHFEAEAIEELEQVVAEIAAESVAEKDARGSKRESPRKKIGDLFPVIKMKEQGGRGLATA